MSLKLVPAKDALLPGEQRGMYAVLGDDDKTPIAVGHLEVAHFGEVGPIGCPERAGVTFVKDRDV